jgi:hypothetical protein
MQRRFNDVIFHKTLKSAVVLLASNPYLKDKNYTTVNLDFTLYVRSYSTQGTVTVSSRYGRGQLKVRSRSTRGTVTIRVWVQYSHWTLLWHSKRCSFCFKCVYFQKINQNIFGSNHIAFGQILFRRILMLTWASRDLSVTVGVNGCI